jgi:hypothetical protein
METQPAVLEDNFLNFTTLEEMGNIVTRKVVRSNASKFGRRSRRKSVDLQPGLIVQTFLAWRYGPAKAEDHCENQIAGKSQEGTASPRVVAQTRQMLEPPCTQVSPTPAQGRRAFTIKLFC